MEREGEQLSARPALETEGLRFLHVTGESPLATGRRLSERRHVRWVVLCCVLRGTGETWPAVGRWRRTQAVWPVRASRGGLLRVSDFAGVLYFACCMPFRVQILESLGLFLRPLPLSSQHLALSLVQMQFPESCVG
jgi:hypothetical protein